MGEVVEFTGSTTQPIDPQKVLAAAYGAKLDRVTIIGTTAAGEFYLASSEGDAAQLLWDMERAKLNLLESEPA